MFATDNAAAVTPIDFLGQQVTRPAWHERPITVRPQFDVSAFLQPSYENENLLADLAEIESLDENWDGYGAVQISAATVANARAYLNAFASRLPAPDMTPNPHGTISLEWESELGLAHLEIGADTYALFVRPRDGDSLYFDGEAGRIEYAVASEVAALLYPLNQRHAISEATLVFGELA